MPITFDPHSNLVPLARAHERVLVCRYYNGQYVPLPNVVCLGISARVGPEPWSARFRYAFDTTRFDPTIYPFAMEHTLPLVPTWAPGVASPYVVRHEDRLVALRLWSTGNGWEVLFDGFALLPQADYGDGGELVTFECVGTPVREWDTPIPGALQRDGDDPRSGDRFLTALPARFNPSDGDGRQRGNRTPDGSEANLAGELKAHAFLDPGLRPPDEEDRPALWSVYDAVRYLLLGMNPNQEYVRHPDVDALEFILGTVRPVASDDEEDDEDGEGATGAIDWSDPSTYTIEQIVARDTDVTGMAWPEAIAELVGPFGFLTFFDLYTTAAGAPEWRFTIRRADSNTYWKSIGLQRQGETFDPRLTAAGAVTIQRDGLAANEIVVDTAPPRYEASFVLAPIGWEPDAADVATHDGTAAGEASRWTEGAADFNPIEYRAYGLDECGEGHWDYDGAATVTDPPDLAPVFHPEVPDAEARLYVRRRRPGSMDLATTGEDGEPLKAELWAAKLDDYSGPVPGVWDGDTSVKWQKVDGGWDLLDDRLGVILTSKDPVVKLAKGAAADKPAKGDKIKLITSQADPDDANPLMIFRLTTVIEGDRGLPGARANRRAASPSAYRVRRHVDGRDRYGKAVVTEFSHHNVGGDGRLDVRDDTDAAKYYAEAMRKEAETVRFAGSITVKRLTTAVRLADKITGLPGRNLGFRMDSGGEGETPRYPAVVGIDWTLEGGQATRLQLSDRRVEDVS